MKSNIEKKSCGKPERRTVYTYKHNRQQCSISTRESKIGTTAASKSNTRNNGNIERQDLSFLSKNMSNGKMENEIRQIKLQERMLTSTSMGKFKNLFSQPKLNLDQMKEISPVICEHQKEKIRKRS